MEPEPRKKKTLTFHYPGCLPGILIMVYYNPHITGQYNPLYTPNNQGFYLLNLFCSEKYLGWAHLLLRMLAYKQPGCLKIFSRGWLSLLNCRFPLLMEVCHTWSISDWLQVGGEPNNAWLSDAYKKNDPPNLPDWCCSFGSQALWDAKTFLILGGLSIAKAVRWSTVDAYWGSSPKKLCKNPHQSRTEVHHLKCWLGDEVGWGSFRRVSQVICWISEPFNSVDEIKKCFFLHRNRGKADSYS